MKDYWFLAFVRRSNECVFENQLGEQNGERGLPEQRPPGPRLRPRPPRPGRPFIYTSAFFILCD